MEYRSLDPWGLVADPLSGDLWPSSTTQVNGLDSPRNTVGSAELWSSLFGTAWANGVFMARLSLLFTFPDCDPISAEPGTAFLWVSGVNRGDSTERGVEALLWRGYLQEDQQVYHMAEIKEVNNLLTCPSWKRLSRMEYS